MKIHIGSDSLNSDNEQRIIYDFIQQLLSEYKIRPSSDKIYNIIGNPSLRELLCDWVKSRFDVTLTTWDLDSVGSGFELEENAEYTKYLLTKK